MKATARTYVLRPILRGKPDQVPNYSLWRQDGRNPCLVLQDRTREQCAEFLALSTHEDGTVERMEHGMDGEGFYVRLVVSAVSWLHRDAVIERLDS